MSTKRERFEKIAVNRTNRVLNDLRLLGNCSNRNNYQFSEADIKKIFSTIENELAKTKAKFYEKTSGISKFTL